MLSLITHSHTLSLFSHTNSSHSNSSHSCYPWSLTHTMSTHSHHLISLMLSLITHSHQVFSHTHLIPVMLSLNTHSHTSVIPACSHSCPLTHTLPSLSLITHSYHVLSPISPISHIPQLIDHHRSSPPITTYSLPNASTHDPNTIQRPNSTPNPPNSSPQTLPITHPLHHPHSRTPLIYQTTQPIQSRRWDKPQGLAGQSQLIPSQYPLHTKSSTKDCIDNTISFNTIQIVFLYPKRIKYSYVKYILSL